MKLIVSASTITIVSGAILSPANDATTLETKREVTKQVDAAYAPTNQGQRYLGQECQPATEASPDVGLLGCRSPNAICSEDEASSLGGRCMMDRTLLTPKPGQPVFSNRQANLAESPRHTTPRFLQNDSWSCPTDCPKDFCKCAQKHGEVKECVREMDDLCLNGIVSNCVPQEYLPFYYATYCPFSECMVANNAYENCSCQYYRDYCTLYYAFNESTVKCGIAGCCEAAASSEEKIECLPGMQPTMIPTMSPTISKAPSFSPTVSVMPTFTPKPTVSPKPTVTPTISSKPTISSAPSGTPSAKPTDAPTVSSPPTVAATESPSVSFKPTVSPAPTNKPTITMRPTESVAPSFAPSESFPPTNAPTLTPTNSTSPSMTPTSEVPTYAPTLKPSRRPTRPPTPPPTPPPVDSTEPPTLEEDIGVDAAEREESGASLTGSTLISSLVGLAGAVWFFVW